MGVSFLWRVYFRLSYIFCEHTLVSCCQTQKNVGLGIQKKFPEYEKSSSDMPTFVSIQALNDCTQTYNKR